MKRIAFRYFFHDRAMLSRGNDDRYLQFGVSRRKIKRYPDAMRNVVDLSNVWEADIHGIQLPCCLRNCAARNAFLRAPGITSAYVGIATTVELTRVNARAIHRVPHTAARRFLRCIWIDTIPVRSMRDGHFPHGL